MHILSDNLVAYDQNVENTVMKNIPIAVLNKDAELEIAATTRKGKGGEDMKFSLIKDIKFTRVKKVMGKLLKYMEKYMVRDLHYGRKYLLEKSGLKYELTNEYCVKMSSIMMDVKSVLMIGLMTLRRRMVGMRDIDVEELETENVSFYNFKIYGIDYVEASMFVNMLLKRQDIKIATYTRKHLLDDFFEFKIEFTNDEKVSILQIKEEEMEKVIKLVDQVYKEIKLIN